MKLEKDTTISHYKILSEIGKGGMGEVYLARDTKLNRQVAIKFLSDEFSKDADKLNRFIQEAQSASALNHPNIITIYEIGEFDGTNYIATEFIEGETLNKYLKASSIKLGSVLDIAIQVASALDEAHSAGIVHRDIKPDNVMVRENGLVKILDFGIAKLTEQEKPEIDSEDATAVQVNTTPGMVIGTANYMSPEQAKGKEIDARTDIFSFGVLLYQMVAGRLPFEGDSPLEIIGSILNKEPKPLNDEEVPADLAKIISKSLRKDRDERYQTIKGLLADLKELKEDLAIQEKLDKTVHPDRKEQDTQVFEATTAAEVEQTTKAGTNDSITIKKSSFSIGLLGAVAALVVAFIGLGYWYFSGSKQIDSIAVMPFVNESGNEDVEYLSDGITDSLITSLANIPNLSVKARSTVFYYKGKKTSPKIIGEELGVEAVLLGRLVQRGEQLKLSLELVDTNTQDAIWSESYNRKMSDLVALQSEIARNVSENLRLKLADDVQDRVGKSDTVSSEAQQLYLKGIYHFNRRGSDGELVKAVSFFRQAIEKDPNHALAYTGLADVYTQMPHHENYRSTEYLPKGKEAALRAIELNKDLAQAHAALANNRFYAFDFAEAEKEFKKAIELDPKYAYVRHWYGQFLLWMGRAEEGFREREEAEKLDPFNLLILNTTRNMLLIFGRYDEAIAQQKKILELFPERKKWAGFLAGVYRQKGMKKEAEEQFRLSLKQSDLSPEEIQKRIGVFESEGFEGVIRYGLEQFLAEAKARLEKDPNAIIQYRSVIRRFAQLKNKEKALEYLAKSYEQRQTRLISIKMSPDISELLKDEPEYQAIIKKMGFPES